jgi:hypothetical protein
MLRTGAGGYDRRAAYFEPEFSMFQMNILIVTEAGKRRGYGHLTRCLSVAQAFAFIAQAVRGDNPAKYLNGPVCHSGFKRLT